MNLEMQRTALSFIANNRELLAICSSIMKPSYFDPELRKPVKFLLEYFDKYHDVPKTSVMRAETGIILDDVVKIDKSDISFISQELETFCRDKAVTEAILKGPALLEKGNFEQIINVLRDAISVGLQKDLGINYFLDPANRLVKTLESNTRYSTGFLELDEMIGGGLGRQELLTILAPSGGGKSMTMLNIGKNLLKQGLNGVYITLEMSESAVSKRLDSMISSISQDNLAKNIDKVSQEIEKVSEGMGTFIIKRMPENRTNITHIRAFCKQVEQSLGIKIDFVILDYLDITGSSSSINTDNMFLKDKMVTEEVRSLGFDLDAIMISASQLGRHAEETEKYTQSNIQGGMSKINTSDTVIGVRQNELMRASGEIFFEMMKTRNSGHVGKRLLLGWDPISLSIFSLNKSTELKLKKNKSEVFTNSDKITSNTSNTGRQESGILGLFNIQNNGDKE